MKIPTSGNFDTINRVLFVHRLRVIRVNVAPDMIGTHNFAVTDGFNGLNGWRRQRRNDELRTRGARGDKHEWDECEIFHNQNNGVEFALGAFGFGVAPTPNEAVGGNAGVVVLSSSANGFSVPPISASLRSIV